ncbi:DUF2163 domain-containing protein [Jannaschia sp. W003]|uniref:DUF2163 domain-containing protein n=1 Tax=Jannaschia sp. W003 TaxID=2867012 RepID=UPI0021A8E81D|nr:DUF2163 domain-containing protein [Jannaschia sp. W003]UWQ20999.1 DUF2163 domain-containing protein [Jannaschia sp. W003]
MSALAERMDAGASTVARAWVVRRRDGTTLGFTDHDRDLAVEGSVCRAASALAAGAIETGTGLAVDNGSVSGALSDAAIRAEDVRAGRWDAAEVWSYLVDWRDPSAFEVLFRGTLGEITEGGGRFSAELRGLAEPLNAVRGRVYHGRCDAVLGDARCGVGLEAPGRSAVATVQAVEGEGRVLRLGGAGAVAAGRLARGRVRFEDGAAAGLSAAIKVDRVANGVRIVELWVPPGAVPAVGDRARVEVGCDKALATCRDAFGNAANFRGFPHVPGDDWLMAVPAAGRR